jgi:hypothetical protein
VAKIIELKERGELIPFECDLVLKFKVEVDTESRSKFEDIIFNMVDDLEKYTGMETTIISYDINRLKE